ncbi:SpaA isopeptide-forming pilin-related protein [Draconibacterium orientale]|uniref:SpaA isopeptide-forming pilin-related protein n=1 Tax=Draconibacterium orientale TaxID=1168034 RepID=UPI002ABE384E|nr:SPOR domain-containing protein [Draconibacterium orientale]
MKKGIFLFTFFLFIINSVVSGQHIPVEINILKEGLKVKPTQVVNLPVLVKNNGDDEQDIEVILNLPDGWKGILQKQTVRLAKGGKKLLLFSFQVPAMAPQTAFAVKVQLSNISDPQARVISETTIDVQEREDVSVMLVSSGKYVMAGENLHATFRIQNNGNVGKKLYLEATNCEIEGSKELEVAPGESKEFTAVLSTNPELGATHKSYLSVKAVSGATVYGSAFHSFVVYPKKDYRRDPFFRFPVTASSAYLFTNQDDEPMSGYQFEIAGAGALEPTGKHQLEFLARGPNNNKFNNMGLYDQYYITYQNPNLRLTLGDRTYQFTPLTESSRFGTGVEARMQFGNGFRVGALYVKPRFYESIDYEYAGVVGYKFNKHSSIDFYYISKQMSLLPDVIQMASLNTKINPFPNTYLDLEYSRGYLDGESDDAYRANLNSRFSIFRIAGNYYYAGENYPGYFNNSKFYSANVSARITKKIDFGVYAKEDFQNAQLDTFFTTAPYSRSFQTSLNFKVARNISWRFYWRDYERKDRLDKNKFHYKTRSLNTQFNHRYKFLSYDLNGEYGKTTSLQAEETNNRQKTYRFSSNILFRISSAHSVELFGSLSNVNSFITDDQRTFTFGGSARSRITRNLQAGLYLQNYYDIDQYYQNRNLMRFNFEYRFLKKHKIAANSYYTLFRAETENPTLTLSVGYTYQMGIPLKRTEQVGQLKGHITDNHGNPVEGMVLSMLSETALTDENGQFYFASLPVGRHLLFIDKSKLEINEVTNIPMPLEIDIVGEKETAINFEIAPGARFSGKFLTDESEFPGTIVIELKGEFDNMRISTKSDGSFSFPVLRPGNYLFKVYEATLPNNYSLSKTEYELKLENEQEFDLKIHLEKKKRNIIFKSQGFILTPEVKTVSKNKEQSKTETVKKIPEAKFYSVQIGAFKQKKDKTSAFFKRRVFDFERQTDNLHKYFIGVFANKQDALKLKRELEKIYKNPFVVSIDGDDIQPEH